MTSACVHTGSLCSDMCSSARLCVTGLPCLQLQKRQVKRPGPNNGREFWSCGEHRQQRHECSLIAACVQAGRNTVLCPWAAAAAAAIAVERRKHLHLSPPMHLPP